jgi:hypothetical protein
MVPRHIYAAQYGLGTIGSGETWYQALAASGEKSVKAALRLIFDAGCDDIDSDFSQVSSRAWAMMAARINTGMGAYRECILAALAGEGHTVHRIEKFSDGEARKDMQIELKVERQGRLHERAVEISTAPEIDEDEAAALEQSRSIASKEKADSLKKANLKKRYRVDVTPDLVILDEYGYAQKIKLDYFLGIGRQFLPNRERATVNGMLEAGGGAVWGPDIRRSTISVKIAALELFKIPALLELAEICNTTPAAVALAAAAQKYRADIKRALGFSIGLKEKPVAIVRKFIGALGFKLSALRREGPRGEQIKIYSIKRVDSVSFKLGGEDVIYQVNRGEIFEGWQARDAEVVEQPETPVMPEVEAILADDSVVNRGNRSLLPAPIDYRATTSPHPTTTNHPTTTQPANPQPTPPTLTGREEACLEVLVLCDGWGQYLLAREALGDRLPVVWAMLTPAQQAKICHMRPSPDEPLQETGETS